MLYSELKIGFEVQFILLLRFKDYQDFFFFKFHKDTWIQVEEAQYISGCSY